jgi:lysophospholipase L1-like esterase
MHAKLIIFYFIITLMTQVTMPALQHPGGLHSLSQLETTRSEIAEGAPIRVAAFEALLRQADQALHIIPKPQEAFNVPGFYIDADGHIAAKKSLANDVWAAYSCAIAYQLVQGPARLAYANKSMEILTAWAKTNREVMGYDGDLAMAYIGVGYVFAVELLSDYDGWQAEDFAAVQLWVSRVYLKSCQDIVGRANNWGDWGLVGSMASHYFLDNEAALTADVELLRQKIDHAIAADGHMPLEVKRGKNGLWYTYFSLSPLTTACEIARNASGVDLFQYKGADGAGIEDALDYLMRFCREPDQWPHYREDDLRLADPHGYPGNLFEAMSAIYGKEAYGAWVEDYRPIMVSGHHCAWSVPTLLSPMPLSDPNGLRRYHSENAALPAPQGGEARVVFFGDSITDFWKLDEFFPGEGFINRGIGGQNTRQMRARLSPDVLELQPSVVWFLGGTNDIAQGASDSMIAENVRHIARSCHVQGIQFIICSVLPISDYHKEREARLERTELRPPARILSLNARLKKVATEEAVEYFDLFSEMVDASGQMPADFAYDGLHPSEAGYQVMAPIVLNAVNAANK